MCFCTFTLWLFNYGVRLLPGIEIREYSLTLCEDNTFTPYKKKSIWSSERSVLLSWQLPVMRGVLANTVVQRNAQANLRWWQKSRQRMVTGSKMHMLRRRSYQGSYVLKALNENITTIIIFWRKHRLSNEQTGSSSGKYIKALKSCCPSCFYLCLINALFNKITKVTTIDASSNKTHDYHRNMSLSSD